MLDRGKMKRLSTFWVINRDQIMYRYACERVPENVYSRARITPVLTQNLIRGGYTFR